MKTWAAPIVIALVSAAGLLLALIGDGALDRLATVAVATPVAAVLWALLARRG